MKFEYYKFTDKRVDLDKLNLLGEQGWELVAIKEDELIFKRVINE